MCELKAYRHYSIITSCKCILMKHMLSYVRWIAIFHGFGGRRSEMVVKLFLKSCELGIRTVKLWSCL